MYCPNLTEVSCISIRRLAWALDTSMGKAIEALVELLLTLVDTEKVCSACKDTSKCTACIFKSNAVTPPKMAALLK